MFYKIPRFQRDYSWTLEQWEDLWTDILNTIEDPSQENDSHYMGYLVLQSTDDKTFEVIDGQQRLTTLTLIILAVIKNLQRLIDEKNEPEQNIQRINQIRQTYIGYLDPVSLVLEHVLLQILLPLFHNQYLPQKSLLPRRLMLKIYSKKASWNNPKSCEK